MSCFSKDFNAVRNIPSTRKVDDDFDKKPARFRTATAAMIVGATFLAFPIMAQAADPVVMDYDFVSQFDQPE